MDGSIQQVSFGIWRCLICGEVFLGGQCPSHCPFCGAHAEHFVRVDDASKAPPESTFLPVGELTEKEKKTIQAAIEGELIGTVVYRQMASKNERDTPEGNIFARSYKRLARVEDEHVSILCKLLGVEKKSQKVNEALLKEFPLTGVWKDDIATTLAREKCGAEAYAQYAKEAIDPRAKLVWSALADIEADHVTLETHHLEMLNKH